MISVLYYLHHNDFCIVFGAGDFLEDFSMQHCAATSLERIADFGIISHEGKHVLFFHNEGKRVLFLHRTWPGGHPM